jgi:hypothetical protein
MTSAVDKNSNHLKQYKEDFEKMVLKNESEISGLIKKVQDVYFERISEIKKEQNYQIEKMSKMVNILKTEIENHNVNLKNNSEKILECNKKNDDLCKNINNMVKEQNLAQSVSYSDIIKNKNNEIKHVPVMNKNVPLIVIPKNKQKTEKTKLDLNTKVDPKDLKIKNVENKKNGKILIETDTKENRDKIKAELEKKINVDYDIKIPLELKPCFEIVHMNNSFDESELIEKLKKQNSFLEMSEMKVLKIKKIVKFNREMKNAIIEVDKLSFPRIIVAEKLCIGWERCKVFDAISVRRCFKCKGYNHRSSECVNKETCIKCHQEHKTSECKEKEEMKKCINCIKSNEKFNLGINTDHKTSSTECPVFQKKLKEKKEKIGY